LINAIVHNCKWSNSRSWWHCSRQRSPVRHYVYQQLQVDISL